MWWIITLNKTIEACHFNVSPMVLTWHISEILLEPFLSQLGGWAEHTLREPSRGALLHWLLTNAKRIKSSVTAGSIPAESVDARPTRVTCCHVCICITLLWALCVGVKVHSLRLGWINLPSVNHNQSQMNNFKWSVMSDLVGMCESIIIYQAFIIFFFLPSKTADAADTRN